MFRKLEYLSRHPAPSHAHSWWHRAPTPGGIARSETREVEEGGTEIDVGDEGVVFGAAGDVGAGDREDL